MHYHVSTFLWCAGGSKSLSIAKVPISAVAWDQSRGKDIDDDDQPEWEEGYLS